MDYLKAAVNFVKAHSVWLMALAGAIWAYASPTVIDYVHNHPHLAFWYGLAGVVVAFLMKSPLTP